MKQEYDNYLYSLDWNIKTFTGIETLKELLISKGIITNEEFKKSYNENSDFLKQKCIERDNRFLNNSKKRKKLFGIL